MCRAGHASAAMAVSKRAENAARASRSSRSPPLESRIYVSFDLSGCAQNTSHARAARPLLIRSIANPLRRQMGRSSKLAEIAERGAGVPVEHPRVNPPHRECEIKTDVHVAQNATRHGHRFLQQRLGFFEVIQMF